MSAPTAEEAREQALNLSQRKDAIEAEMDAIFSELTENNGPGLSGNLLDSAGFPRTDMDVVRVRTQRNRFQILRTDHKNVSTEMSRLLTIALAPPANGSAHRDDDANANNVTAQAPPPCAAEEENAPAETTTTHSEPARPSPPRRPPFALVDSVASASPAAHAGLVVGDRVVAFGAVSLRSASTPRNALSALPGLLRDHENRRLDVVVLRDDGPNAKEETLALTPRQWTGRGLLGCHVVPLEVSQIDDRYQPDVVTAVATRFATGLP